ncbi:tRNA pseudouridine(55) synthase TruB [Oceanivirga miroungae]|uniref:tRNA pseudouridine synthase B n=1 Tax=Oceanivirga miroungae TaxID=1130046 RepID=A0A6I8M9L6_9FUSO|nr:tRNA pseudouridine(55) synthase TruB [Oceanivirga miroungae]VWL85507.1 tRNA pseudouridine synthase B [Oceanivirga miroungae]
MENSKIILINKEMNISSHKAIKKVQKEYGFKKIGHAGTLDPRATGLMIAMSDKATKLSDLLMKKDKIYKVELELGYETDTLDLDGQIILKKEYQVPNLDELKDILNKFFKGEIEQIPPMYSAIKINGNKLYNLARKNIQIDIPKRLVKIYDYSDIQINENKISFIVNVSSGTYIRSLVRDIAYKLDTVATMTYLERLSIDKFKNPKDIEIIDVYDALDYKRLNLDLVQCERLKNGLSIFIKKENIKENEKFHIFYENKYLGIADVISLNNGTIELKRNKFFGGIHE